MSTEALQTPSPTEHRPATQENIIYSSGQAILSLILGSICCRVIYQFRESRKVLGPENNVYETVNRILVISFEKNIRLKYFKHLKILSMKTMF